MSHPRVVCSCGEVLRVCPLDHEPEVGVVKRWKACRKCWEEEVAAMRGIFEAAGPPPWPMPCNEEPKR